MAIEVRKREKKTLAQYEQILDQSTNPLVISIWSKVKETNVKQREIKFTLLDEIPTSVDLFAQSFRQIMQEHKDIIDNLKVSLDKLQESCRAKLQQFHTQIDRDVHKAELKIFNLMKELENDVQDLDATVQIWNNRMDELLYALNTNEQETSTSVTFQKFVFSAIQMILNVLLSAINVINENFSFALPVITILLVIVTIYYITFYCM